MQQNVLVIENNNANLDVVAKLVRKAGLVPIGASSLTEARVRFSHMVPESFLCAVVAHVLPDAPKGEAIDFTINAFIPTIVTTENLETETRDKVLAKDVVDYIPKENAQNYDYLNRLIKRLERNKTIGVVVVSTNRKYRRHISSLLNRHNFVVYDCLSAHAAMSILAHHYHVRLVITDNALPDMSGTQFVANLRKAFSKDQLAIMGIADDQGVLMSAHFIKSGANDFLRLPIYHEEFLCRVMQNIEYIESVDAIRRAANTDYLTGLPNRRHFFYSVTVAHQQLPEVQALAIVDLDHFKQINDTYGHEAGDCVLKTVGNLLEKHFEHDMLARFGGEEFCVYLPAHSPQQAESKLETFRLALAATPIDIGDTTLTVTCSIGISVVPAQDIEVLLRAADQQLYHAKARGRNQLSSDNTQPLAARG